MVTPPDLELEAAQALFAARMAVAAVHDTGPWTIQWGDLVVPATRIATQQGVSFIAEFPELCWLTPPTDGAILRCRDQVMAIRRIDHPGDTGFLVRWELALAKVGA